jgi:hypothetical protein
MYCPGFAGTCGYVGAEWRAGGTHSAALPMSWRGCYGKAGMHLECPPYLGRYLGTYIPGIPYLCNQGSPLT